MLPGGRRDSVESIALEHRRKLAATPPYEPTGSQERRAVILLASSMDQYRDLGMREYLDRLAAEDERGDAVAAVRGHDN
jgi:hypothetical protein